jgi:polysaccharide export outer membrane protein
MISEIAGRIMRVFAVLGILLGCSVNLALKAASIDDYRIGAGDLLRISVFGYPDLGGDVRVSQSGNITFPLIGSVPVAGMSPREIETTLSQQLAAGHYIKKSQVTVLVVDYQSQRVTVMGVATNPGQYPLTGTRRVLNILADAGGVVTDLAGSRVVLIHSDGTKMELDLTAMLNGDLSQNPILKGGDVINVPKAPQFYIYGEVQKPGMYKLERNMTVLQAISEGGGLTRRGSERRVVAKRHDERTHKDIQVHLRGPDLVQPDDVLMVKEGWF